MLSDHSWPTKFLSLADGLHNRTPETKSGLNIFTAKCGILFFKFVLSVFLYNIIIIKQNLGKSPRALH